MKLLPYKVKKKAVLQYKITFYLQVWVEGVEVSEIFKFYNQNGDLYTLDSTHQHTLNSTQPTH